jgi:hypothetical protein
MAKTTEIKTLESVIVPDGRSGNNHVTVAVGQKFAANVGDVLEFTLGPMGGVSRMGITVKDKVKKKKEVLE